jgi:ADP-ribosylglycohydrolase
MQTLTHNLKMKTEHILSRLPYAETDTYRQKVRGCWIGKAMGGGIGAPYEGVPGPLALTADDIYIDSGPNDDLEIQLLWLRLMEQHGINLRSKHFASVWLEQMGRGCGCDEYGMAVYNLRRGLTPPATGFVDNWFVNGMGAAIRAEIWGCLFPGNPAAAAFYAEQDAVLDHHGEGVWAEIFLACVVSEAFFCDSAAEALARGLRHIPVDTDIVRAVQFTRGLVEKTTDVMRVRNEIMANYGSHNFTDCRMNLCFITASLLLGKNDFCHTILTAVNFGMDTDCTAATCGALFGLIHGPEAFGMTLPNEHIAVSGFLDRRELPNDISELTSRTVNLAQRLARESNDQPKLDFKPYSPYVIDKETAKLSQSSWLISHEELSPEKLWSMDSGQYDSGIIAELPGGHADLSEYCRDFKTLYLYTFLTVPEDVENAQLLFCAGTGITVWMDDRMVLNYHGRQEPLPAFHRVEGGGTVYCRLGKVQRYLIRVRLIFGRSPLKLYFAAGDSNYHLIPGAAWKFSIGKKNGHNGKEERLKHPSNR